MESTVSHQQSSWPHSGHSVSGFCCIFLKEQCLCKGFYHWGKNTMTKSNSQVTFYHWRKSRQELESGTWWQGLKQKPQRNDVFWIAPHDLISLLLSNSQNACLGVAPPMVDCVFLHQSLVIIKRCTTDFPLGSLREALFSIEIPLPK